MFEFETVTWLGLIAAFCTTISLLPQAIKVITQKQTRDISLTMYIIFTSGVLLWLIYGILTKDMPVMLANAITFVLSFTILLLKIKYK
ncbi:MAG: SemiSWEET transporter [Deltaproteobacteria bacterium]|nr:SemiSWEET transporter [Deltaproteobacteria bacterium]